MSKFICALVKHTTEGTLIYDLFMTVGLSRLDFRVDEVIALIGIAVPGVIGAE